MEEEAAVALTRMHPAILRSPSAIAAHGNDIILRKKDRGIWQAVTWTQLGARVREVGMGLTGDRLPARRRRLRAGRNTA